MRARHGTASNHPLQPHVSLHNQQPTTSIGLGFGAWGLESAIGIHVFSEAMDVSFAYAVEGW